MKPKVTLYLLVIAVALFGLLYLAQREWKGTVDEIKAADHVVEVDRDKITAVSIKNQDGQIELQKRDNNWYVNEPVKDRADNTVMSTLFTTLEDLKHTTTMKADKDQLKEFGLADPTAKITLTIEKEKPVEIDIGKDAAVGGKVYAIVAGSNTVQVIPSELKNQITKKTDDFRDSRLADLTMQQVTKIDVKSAAGQMELDKKNNHWSIAKPIETRGEDSKINDLLSQASTAHVDKFITDQNLAAYGLAEPAGTIDFTLEGSDKPLQLLVGTSPKEEKDKNKVYAKLSSRDCITLVAKGPLEALLNAKANEIRDKNLVRFESDIVDRLTLEAAGKPKVVLARKGESWVRKEDGKDAPVDSAPPKRALSELQSAQVTKFVSDSAADAAKYGLDQPSLKVTLSSFASENTAESDKGEKPIVTILFGKTEGNDVYAKLDTEPFIVSTPKTILDVLPADPVLYQDLTIDSFKMEDFTALDVKKEGRPEIGLERDKDKKWKLVKGEGTINESNIQSVLSSLATLRANRWVGATTPEQGLDKPLAVISFTVTKDDKPVQGKVTIGAEKPKDQWYATAEGTTGTFLMNRADEDALMLALTDKDVAPPAPAPAAPAPAAPAPSTPQPSATPPGTPAAPAPATPPATPAAPVPATPPAPAAAPATPAPNAAPSTAPAPAPAAGEAKPAAPPAEVPTPAAPAPAAPPAPAENKPAPAPEQPAPAPVPAPAPTPAAPPAPTESKPAPETPAPTSPAPDNAQKPAAGNS
jgi:hypothetical protein